MDINTCNVYHLISKKITQLYLFTFKLKHDPTVYQKLSRKKLTRSSNVNAGSQTYSQRTKTSTRQAQKVLRLKTCKPC